MTRNFARVAIFFPATIGGALVARSIVRRTRHFDLRGRNAVVTGGARGLGLSIARSLAHRGASVAICSRDEAQLRDAQIELSQIGTNVLAIGCDVTNAGDVDRFLDQVRSGLGPIHVLINNAGTITVGPMEAMKTADYQRSMNTHYWAPLQFIFNVLPEMRRRRQEVGGLLLPVVLKPCLWKVVCEAIQAVPRSGGKLKPIEDWDDPARGFACAHEEIAAEIERHFQIPIRSFDWSAR